MSISLKESHYNDRQFNYSLSTWVEDINQDEYKKLKELSKNPLTQDLLQQALQDFGKTAFGSGYNYLSFKASEKELYGLLGIEKYTHLQYIDVSKNNLINLKPLSGLKYITYLNASHNNITKFLQLKDLPYNLEELNLSNNKISQLVDLYKHRFLQKLDLSNNKIQQIQGLKQNKNLKVLNLSGNLITEIEQLEDLNLVELNLSQNQIKNIEGLNRLEKLRILNLQNNKIVKLKGLTDLVSIRELWLSNNRIKHIKELQYLENLQYFSVLDLCFNPVQTSRYYRFQVLYRLPGLRVLDGVLTTPEEFVKSENLYGLDLEERREIFKEILPEEEFIDRRINIGELIEPETESDNEENMKFQDKYDKEGNVVELKSASMRKTLNGTQKSLRSSIADNNNQNEDQFRATQNSHKSLMNETARRLQALRQGSQEKIDQRSQVNTLRANSNQQ